MKLSECKGASCRYFILEHRVWRTKFSHRCALGKRTIRGLKRCPLVVPEGKTLLEVFREEELQAQKE